MDSRTISNWIRQARYRAKKLNIYNDLELQDVLEIIRDHQYKCAYCDDEAETLDNPYPYKDEAPGVIANVLPCCKKCRDSKNKMDLTNMHSIKLIDTEKYLSILKQIFVRKGGDLLREHVKKISGLGEHKDE